MKLGIGWRARRALLALRMRQLTRPFLVGPVRPLYQPLPWAGIESAKRDRSTRERMELMQTEIGPARGSVLDVGSCVGFFSITLAQSGHWVMGVEASRWRNDIAQVAAKMARAGNVAFINAKVTPATVLLLPRVDVVLCLSIFHHWARNFGLDEAKNVLRALWDRTGSKLFFETGAAELPSFFNMSVPRERADEWISGLLESTCPGGSVVKLGQVWAFPSEQFAEGAQRQEDQSFSRTLFCVRRQPK